MVRNALVALASAFLAAVPASAQDATFNFEDQSVSTGLTSISTTQSGVTLGLSRPGSTFGFANTSLFGGPASYGSRTLSPFEAETSNTAFLLNFSSSLSGISVDYGDFGADSDLLTIIGYSGLNGTGSQVFSTSAALPFIDSSFHGSTLSSLSNVSPFQSVTVLGGSPGFPQCLYYDNIKVYLFDSAVPETSTWAMMLLGFAGIGWSMRRKRSSALRLAA